MTVVIEMHQISKQGSSTLAPTLNSINIFVVEDDQATGESLVAVVRTLGYDPELFKSAEELLQRIENVALPGCVITDIRLPGMSGMELLAELEKLPAIYSTIVVTGYANTAMTVEAIRSGAVTVLDKPFMADELATCIQRALQQVQDNRDTHIRMQDVRDRLSNLTQAEHQILEMLIEGKPNKAMASKLKLSTRTIENRRRQLYEKMSAFSVPELVRMVVELNLHDEARKR